MKKANYDFVIGLFLITFFSIFFAWDCINTIQYQLIQYDEAYNATVAANVMRYGEYRVSYPSDIVFYNIITTGETVILPTALIYEIWGINSITSSIVAVIYGVGCIWATWGLLKICLRDFVSKSNIVAAIGSVSLILSDGLFADVSTHLIGEAAALFFVLIGFIFLKIFSNTQKLRFIFLSGSMFAFAFLTKSSMIFIIVSIMGMMFIETIIVRPISLRNMVAYIGGFVGGFIILDSYKLLQLGGVSQYIKWWNDEWLNMLNQSSGVDTKYSILNKIQYLGEIFFGCNEYLCVFLSILPVVIWLALVIYKFRRKGDFRLEVMTLSGVCGASLIIYFILLGGSGLVYARRHEVNQYLVRLYIIYIAFVIIICAIKKLSKKNLISSKAMLLGAILLYVIDVPFSTVRANFNEYIAKDYENSYSAELMDEFLKEVERLPNDATLYCAGWWQEPDISLYLNRKMVSIYEVIHSDEVLAEESYFISGNFINDISKEEIESALNVKLIRIDNSEVDYNRFVSGFDRADFENFAIYKICINSYPEYNLEDELSFVATDDNGHKYVKNGFSFAEEEYSWTNGKSSEIWLTASDALCESYHIAISVKGAFNGAQDVIIKSNGNECFNGKILDEESIIEFDVNNNNNGKIDVGFYIPHANSPMNMGVNDDSRMLGIRINKIIIKAN